MGISDIEVRLMKLSSTFDSKMELAYKMDKYENDLNYIRIMLMLCVILYSSFSLIDIQLKIPETNLFLFIRFALVNPFFIIGILLSFHRSFFKMHQIVLVVDYLAAGFGIIAMLLIVPDNFSYYGGMFLIFGVGHFLTRIYWQYASMASYGMVLSYLILSFILSDNYRMNLIYIFFYSSFIFICVYGSYTFERYRRDKYLQTHHLKDDNVVLKKEIYDKLIEVENANRITIFSLARLSESRDHFTGDHIERVGNLCLKVSENLPAHIFEENNIDREQFLESIELASTLHDIGKVAIPEHILMKPGKLNDEEMATMKMHTTYGYDTLVKIKALYEKNNFINMGIHICKYHHEKYDGSGYPDGLSGNEIPLAARIVAVVDVYDALVSERPYKKAYSQDKALSIIKEGSGNMFDPLLVDVFLNSLK